MAVMFDYFRGGRQVSLRGLGILLMGPTVLATAGLLPVWAQYPGQVTKSSKDTPELRAIAVLEWTGEPGKPKSSRIVPVAVLDGGRLQDGGIYLARPEPLALAGEVEYELEQNGKPVGLFDIENSGREQGSWVGYGTWKPMPAAAPKPSKAELARTRIDDDVQSDQPVLHRKHHAGDAPAGGAGSGGSGGGNSGSGSAGPAPASDPDRPTLHKKPSSDSTGDASPSAGSAGSTTGTGDADTTSTSSSTTPDEDRPTLHRKDSGTSPTASSGGAPADDPDRPALKKSKKEESADVAHVDSLPETTDPDRPRLKRGKSTGYTLNVIPSLMGLPPDMQQAVAVSDSKTRPEHPWTYAWANPDDEAKMKAALEDIARDALGLKPPPPVPTPAPKPTAAKRNAKPAPPPPPPAPAPLVDEQFRVFELAYSSGATLVLTAHTDGQAAERKFVTLVAQPDLYGNVLVLLKSVTDGAHLDETPRMRLVDAVDALADNRGELLFELRGDTVRQFALYRVLRGRAEKLFVTGGGEFGSASTE
jgi:hypothetical protein